MEACRLATEVDRERLVELALELRTELAAERGGVLWGSREAGTLDYGRDDLQSDDHHVWVGTFHDSVVSYCYANYETTRAGVGLVRIVDLFVEPDARAVGVGEEIANAVVAWATERNAVGVDAPALPGMRHSKNFFETHGFVARLLIMHKRLTDA